MLWVYCTIITPQTLHSIALKIAGIPLNRITLVARTVDPDDVAISESQFFQHRTIEQLEKGVQEWGIYKVL